MSSSASLQRISTENAPGNQGVYSQAVVAGNTVYCSGSIGLDPATKKLASDTFEGQLKQTLANLTAVLRASGASLSDVAKVTVYLLDMQQFNNLNAIYTQHFSAPFPARTCIAVAALPMGALVEIEAIAVLPAAAK